MAQVPTSFTSKVNPDLGCGLTSSDPASDHRSIYSRGDDLSGGSVITPAQAYARAVKTGENYDRSLYYTIERKQPDRRTELQAPPSQPGNPGSERGASYAQRLYASAVSNKSPTALLSSISIPTPHNPACSPPPALPISTGRQSSRGTRQHPNPPRSPSLFDTSTEVTPTFSPADFYHSSVATHGFPSGTSTNPELSARRPYIPVSQSANALLSSPVLSSQSPSLAAYSPPRAFHSQSQLLTLQHEVASIHRPVSQTQAAPPSHEAAIQAPATYDPRTVYDPPPAVPIIGTSPPDAHILHTTAAANVTTSHLPSYAQRSPEVPPVSSPPPFEEHEISPTPTGAASALISLPSQESISHDGLFQGSLTPPPDAGHEEVPLYSLVDEQHPPPAFDDVDRTSDIALSPDEVRHDFASSTPEVPGVPSCPSSPSPPPPSPPLSHGTTRYPIEKVPSYSLLDPSRSSYSMRPNRRSPDVDKSPTSIISTAKCPPSDSRKPGLSPPSPPMSPLHAAPLYGTAFPSTLPSQTMSHPPSGSRPPSVLSSRSADGPSTRFSYDHPALSTSPPPPVAYHKKPTQQSKQSFPPPTMTQRSSNASGMERNTMASSWSSSRPQAAEPLESVRLANVTEDDGNIDTLTHAMSNISAGPYSRRSSDTSSFMRENAYGGQSHTGRTLLGNQQDMRGFHPSGVSQTADAQNQAMYGAGAGRLLQEAYQLVHPGTDVEARLAIQGSVSGLSQETQRGLHQINDPRVINPANTSASTHDPSSRYSPRTSTVPCPAPSAHSHDEPHIQSARSAECRSAVSQLGGVAGDPQSRSCTDGPRTTSMGSNPPPAVQSPHYLIDRYTHVPAGPQASFVPASSQQQNIQLQQPSSDTLQGRGHIGPPPPPLPNASQARRASQTPQTSLYSQDVTNYQVGPCTGGAALTSNDLARRFALDALSVYTDPNTRVFQDANQHLR
ncbi:hypothetical protein BDN67DRAFT_967349 [Paxillus ammoniavirescens]|nr:hypothetical protein BDN67DRAFT_967349 [Paxillus ammoniavirescens]